MLRKDQSRVRPVPTILVQAPGWPDSGLREKQDRKQKRQHRSVQKLENSLSTPEIHRRLSVADICWKLTVQLLLQGDFSTSRAVLVRINQPLL